MQRYIFLFLLFFAVPGLALAQGSAGTDTFFPVSLVTVLSAVLPYSLKWLKTKVKSETMRFAIAMLASAVTGAGGALYAGVSYTDLVPFITTAFAASQVAYRMFWKPIWSQET